LLLFQKPGDNQYGQLLSWLSTREASLRTHPSGFELADDSQVKADVSKWWPWWPDIFLLVVGAVLITVIISLMW
jgi:hypothetical protein